MLKRACLPTLLLAAALVSGCSKNSNRGLPDGGGGAGGNGGSGGSGAAGGGGGAGGSGGASGASGSQSVLQRGKDIYRSGMYFQPGLTAVAAAAMAPDTTFNMNATFPANGSLLEQGTASVLFLAEGPAQAGCPTGATGCTATMRGANSGLFFAFPALGANPNVVAFDEITGLPVWTAHVTPGGDGIRGTPAIDLPSRRLFVVTGGNPHVVHALSIDNGVEVTSGGWPVTLSSTTISYSDGANTYTFNSVDQNQHGALLLLNNILYIPFGGHYGDGGSYRGWIVAVDITSPANIAGWTTRSARSGIWGSGGLASDGSYVFGVTGDTTGLARNVSDSQEVVRVKGMAQFVREAASVFVPSQWQLWDRPQGDLDFGASTPAFVPLPPGSNPPSLLIAPAKAGRVFVLNGANLSGGIYPAAGGELAEVKVADLTSESVYTAPTIYRSASGLRATINVGKGPLNCPMGTPASDEMIISILLQPGQMPIAKQDWCVPNVGGGHTNYPPISTTSDGVSADALVWFIHGSQLSAVDGDTGHAIVTTNGTPCDSVPSMSFPIAVKNRIVVSARGHLCSWSPNGQ